MPKVFYKWQLCCNKALTKGGVITTLELGYIVFWVSDYSAGGLLHPSWRKATKQNQTLIQKVAQFGPNFMTNPVLVRVSLKVGLKFVQFVFGYLPHSALLQEPLFTSKLFARVSWQGVFVR